MLQLQAVYNDDAMPRAKFQPYQGYHRLWAHKAYRASPPLKYLLAILGAGSWQWSIIWWVTHHRAHHRYLDTHRDPYNARRGLFYSHIGWLLVRHSPASWGKVDISDVVNDLVALWQRRYYLVLAFLSGLVFPAAVAHLGWNDWMGGFVYAGALRILISWHCAFCVNSVAHYSGSQPFSDRHTPRDSLFTALLTLGEGYHNFHHEFPSDYRNGVRWFDADVGKWAIACYQFLGLASNLQRVSDDTVATVRLQQRQKSYDQKHDDRASQLPVMSWDQYICETLNGRSLVAIAGFVHDISDFVTEHPGGRALIQSAVGKDATAMFTGGVYDHSNHANTILARHRVGVLRGGGEIEMLKSESIPGSVVRAQ